MHFYGNAAAVVFDGHGAVVVDPHGDLAGVARHCLVDRVIDDLVGQMMQAAASRIGNVHAGALADVLQVAEVFQLVGAVLALDLMVRGQLLVLIAGGL